jgi:hypothetical protein
MGRIQEYFWICICDDGTQYSEYNPEDAERTNSITPEIRQKTIYFGLASNREGHFFDLLTGEYHYKNQLKQIDKKQKLTIPFDKNIVNISTPLQNGKRCDFYQYKSGYTDMLMSGNGIVSNGNCIAEHFFGYKVKRLINGKEYFIDVKMTIDVGPNNNTLNAQPKLEVILKLQEEGPILDKFKIDI